MLWQIISFLFSLAFLPVAGLLIGGFFDFGNQKAGNFRYDLPSTFGFLLGLVIDICLIIEWVKTLG